MKKWLAKIINQIAIIRKIIFLFILLVFQSIVVIDSVYSYQQSEEKQRPIAVMVGNSPEERSVQTGLNAADIIYEIPVEFPFTRYMA
ncbi:MAG: DUF3048 domain-containing protein, partial [Candidatus Atribacteria bacterium]|nr:DUF3048 domain-containing protein [Candidatus Atribacteria bacterium]